MLCLSIYIKAKADVWYVIMLKTSSKKALVWKQN